MIIKNGVLKIKIIFSIFFWSFVFLSSLYAQNIEVLPLINLNELEPTYEDEVIDQNIENNLKDSDFINSKNKNFEESFATISLLNKITAEVKTINIKLKENYLYEELKIYAIDCYNSNPLEKAETAVYLNIYIDKTMEKIFNGWMVKSLPSISSMEHPIYDLWVDDCYKL
tara:strand:+ start:174 stop:683 length:510 start_codon:yes stop_codon:yes gene_type:complete